MRWVSALSRERPLEAAVAACAARVREELGGERPDLVLIFASHHFGDYYHELYGAVEEHLRPGVLLGCSGGGVIGGGEEVEQLPALSMVAASLPGVELTPFHLRSEDLPDLDGPPGSWHELVGANPASEPHFVLLADPFSFRPDLLLPGMDYAYPGAAKVGGLASGFQSPGMNSLFINESVLTEGTAGLALSGNIDVATVVAQGCRPIGEVMQVTRAEKNLIHDLDGTPALTALQEMLPDLDERDRKLVQFSLHVGVVMDEFVEEPGRGDFLIRNLVGADPTSGVIGISQAIPEGTRIQFHLQDDQSSAEDLRGMLEDFRARHGMDFSGSLFFSCLARGQGLYKRPNLDTGLLAEVLGEVPTAGFFCNSEIGAVGGSTHLHAYTASIGFFREKGSG